MKQYATIAWNRPMLGSEFNGLDMCAEWTIHACQNSSYSVGWHCPPNAPRKQWKDQVAADVTTHLPRRLYRDPLMAAASMTTERGAWRGLRYGITGINRHRDQSSERAHLDVSSVVG